MNNQTTYQGKVPFGQKVAFGLGMLANQMFPAALGIFMVVLVQDLGFPGWMWGVLFFLPRVFDSITDPIMGFISDNTKSIWGRRRQYVFLGAIIMGIAFIMMWQLYRENGVDYNFIYFLLWSFVFFLGLTIFSVPYVAMGYEMTDDFHERTNIMATAQFIGQWAWVIAPWLWVVMYDQNLFPNADTATRTLAIYVGILCAILAMVPAIFIKSKSTLNDESLTPITYKTLGGSLKKIILSFKEAFLIKQFRQLCISTFLIFNAFNTVAAFSFFIVVYHLFNGNTEAAGVWPSLFGSLGAIVTTFLVIPIVAKMSRVMGKKKAFIWSQSISIIGYILLWFLFIPGKPYMFIFALPFFSFGIGSLFTLMMSMTADVCDLDELQSGKRREGIFGAIYWWMVKFGFAIAGLLSGIIISLVGFVPGAETQTESAVTGLRLFYSGLPIVGTLIAIYVMRNYDLSEEKANEVQKILAKRKAPKPSGYTSTNVMGNLDLKALSKEELLKKFPNLFQLPINFKKINQEDLKKHFHETFNQGMHGVCFSAYLKNQKPGDYITEEQIVKRLKTIQPHTQWIRVFSTTNGHEKIPVIAKEMGFKTVVGAWISDDIKQNQIELHTLSSLIDQGVVDIAAVGNEVLFRGQLDQPTLLKYINQIKANAKGTPVCYIDTYYELINHPELVNASDIVMINCYPFWEGASIEHASLYLQEMYRKTKEVAPNKKVVISETGWPSKGDQVKGALPSEGNVMTYFVEIQQWAKHHDIDLFYFSSFDESWKIHDEGWAGKFWGLWNDNEKLKY